MNTKSESDESMMTTNETSSPGTEEIVQITAENIRTNSALKKGPWTASEDAILVEYVQKNGEGNWNAIQKHAELARCGKSCRLRWTNHLKPDLKKGAFSQEEERIVVEMQARLGNKWARMAAELPGRTDNEIKNFWNTRMKRRLRLGLPIYPPNLSVQPLTENHPSEQPITTLAPINKLVEFRSLDQNDYIQSTPTAFPGFPLNNIMSPAPLTSYPINDALFSNMCMPSSTYPQPQFQSHVHSPVYNNQENFFASPVYNDQGSCSNCVSLNKVSFGTHPFTNGNYSSPLEPAQALKVDLPSFQTQHGARGCSGSPPSSLPWPSPSIEPDGFLAQTLLTDDVDSMQNSELLDAVIRGSRTNSRLLSQVPYGSSQMTATSGNARDLSLRGSWSTSPQEMEWDAYCPPISSSSSVLSSGTPNSSELEYVDLNPGEANNLMIPEQNCGDLETMYDNIFFGPEHLP